MIDVGTTPMRPAAAETQREGGAERMRARANPLLRAQHEVRCAYFVTLRDAAPAHDKNVVEPAAKSGKTRVVAGKIQRLRCSENRMRVSSSKTFHDQRRRRHGNAVCG